MNLLPWMMLVFLLSAGTSLADVDVNWLTRTGHQDRVSGLIVWLHFMSCTGQEGFIIQLSQITKTSSCPASLVRPLRWYPGSEISASITTQKRSSQRRQSPSLWITHRTHWRQIFLLKSDLFIKRQWELWIIQRNSWLHEAWGDFCLWEPTGKTLLFTCTSFTTGFSRQTSISWNADKLIWTAREI